MKQQNYSGQFWDWGDVVSNFDLDRSTPEPDFIWASYDADYCDGYATVVFFENRTMSWNIVTGSHCSCHGLEGQFDPEQFNPEVHFKALAEDKRFVGDYTWGEREKCDFDEWFKWAVEHTS